MNFMNTFPTKALLTTFLAAVSYSPHAFGADEQGRAAVTVQYGDLNLSAPEGVDTLKRRLSSAAQQVCADEYRFDPFSKFLVQGCVREATDKALAQVNWPNK